MIEICVETQALADIADSLDVWVKYFRDHPVTTPLLAQALVNPPAGSSEEKYAAVLALMLATAIQRMAADERD